MGIDLLQKGYDLLEKYDEKTKKEIVNYVILDDRPDWFAPGTSRLVVCDSETGIYDKGVQEQLLAWLETES